MTALAHRVGQLSSANKQKLVTECRRLGIPGNMNVVRWVLRRRIVAHLNALRKQVDEVDDALKQSRLDALLAATSGDLTAFGDGHKSSSRIGREATTEANRTDEATAIVPMDLETGAVHRKRPSSPPTAPANEEAAPAPCRQCRFGDFSVQTEACCPSNAYASVRPAHLDELLATHAEMCHLNVRLRRLPDCVNETEEDIASWVRQVLRTLVGAGVSFCECYRIGRFAGSRPRPVIICFTKLNDKICVLRTKSTLYDYKNCPGGVGFCNLRIYHDVSPLQLDWKLRLRAVFENFRAHGTRVIWRNGYHLMAFLEGVWAEYVPNSILTR